MVNRSLILFSEWFQSAAGVWQTALVVGFIVIIEGVFPHLDPNGFWLLYWLTVYSAVTQPALAYINGISATESKKLAEQNTQMLKNQQHTMEALLAITTQLMDHDATITPLIHNIHQHMESEENT